MVNVSTWRRTSCAVAVGAAALIAGCGVAAPSPAELVTNSVQSYMNALASGYYVSACAQLDTHTRDSLGGAHGCKAALSKCLPYNAAVLKRDQSQLLYATVEVTLAHKQARAAVSGTTVAKALKEVTLAKETHGWVLTSYGQGLTRCVSHARKA